MKIESGVSLNAIKSASRHVTSISFSERQLGRGIKKYEAYLPTFEDRTVTQIIEDRITQGAEILNVLDIGCGRGNFLGELIRKYPQIRGFGISAKDYRDPESDLKEQINQIDYQTGNASAIASLFPGVNFDLVVSVKGLDYIADPLRLIKQAYRKTKEGGVLLVSTFGLLITEPDFLKLQDYLNEQGIKSDLKRKEQLALGVNGDLYLYSYALQRGRSPRLPLPFRYTNASPLGVDYGLTI